MKIVISLLLCIAGLHGFSQCPNPTNIQAKNTSNNSIEVGWDNVPGGKYAIQYKKTASSDWLSISGITTNSYTLRDLDNNTSYDVQVQTLSCTGGGVASALSSSASFSTNKPDPSIQELTHGTFVRKRNAPVLSTNFALPIVRFNVSNNTSSSNAKGNTAFFNSLGAGLSINLARLKTLVDKQSNEEIETDVANIIGLQLGVLYAANTSTGNSTNIFAPTISLTVLDFQFGYGYEYGTIAAEQKRGFFTIAYGIPLYKITDKGAYVFAMKAKGDKPAVRSGFVKGSF